MDSLPLVDSMTTSDTAEAAPSAMYTTVDASSSWSSTKPKKLVAGTVVAVPLKEREEWLWLFVRVSGDANEQTTKTQLHEIRRVRDQENDWEIRLNPDSPTNEWNTSLFGRSVKDMVSSCLDDAEIPSPPKLSTTTTAAVTVDEAKADRDDSKLFYYMVPPFAPEFKTHMDSLPLVDSMTTSDTTEAAPSAMYTTVDASSSWSSTKPKKLVAGTVVAVPLKEREEWLWLFVRVSGDANEQTTKTQLHEIRRVRDQENDWEIRLNPDSPTNEWNTSLFGRSVKDMVSTCLDDDERQNN